MKSTLDSYEQGIEEALSDDQFTSAKDLSATQDIFKEAAKTYLELQKSKSITLRVKNEDLIKVKAKAKRNGLAYQTLIGLLIHQYVTGDKIIQD